MTAETQGFSRPGDADRTIQTLRTEVRDLERQLEDAKQAEWKLIAATDPRGRGSANVVHDGVFAAMRHNLSDEVDALRGALLAAEEDHEAEVAELAAELAAVRDFGAQWKAEADELREAAFRWRTASLWQHIVFWWRNT